MATKTVKKTNAKKPKAAAKPKAKASKKPAAKKVATPVKKAPVKKAKAVKKPAAKKVTATKKPVVQKKAAPKKAVKKTARKAAPKATVKKTTIKAAPKAAPKTTASVKDTTKTPDINIMNLLGMETPMSQQNFQFDQLAQEAANAGRENMEAFIKSGTIFARGFEDLMKAAASMTQGAAEKQAQFAKEMMSSKTLNEFAEAQNKISQANFDEFMAGATKLSEMSVKLLNEGTAPINAQVTKTMQKAGKMAA